MSAVDPFPEDVDPFAGPRWDPATGEILDVEPEPVAPTAPLGRVVEAVMASIGPRLEADPAAFTRELRDALQARVSAYAERLHSQRPPGRLTPAAVAAEVTGLAQAQDRLRDIAGAFTAAADLARDCLQEVTLEVRGDRVEREGGSASVKVGAPGGGDLRVVVTQPTKASVDVDAVVDVIAGTAVQQGLQAAIDAGAKATTPAVVAQVAREALARWRSLTGPPSWKVTALDAWARELEAHGDAAAVKLAAAYGKKPHGRLSTRVEYLPPEPPPGAKPEGG